MKDFRESRRRIEQKDHAMKEKVMNLKEATALIKNGDNIAFGGCMYSRTPMAVVREILKQSKKDLTLSRNLISFDGDLLLAGGCVKKIITSWFSIGVTWGVSKVMRSYMETGRADFEEWSHMGISLRFKAGAMGIPFLPTLSIIGSDLLKHLPAKEITCPFTGVKLCLVPALFPDIAVIHAHRSDVFGNVQIDGPPFIDVDVAYSAEKVIVTVEEIVSNERIRREPDRTVIPFFCVDAVVEVPFGAYPHECYGVYDADYKHFDEYAAIVKEAGVEGVKMYLDKYVYEPESFEDFLNLFSVERLLSRAKAGREVRDG